MNQIESLCINQNNIMVVFGDSRKAEYRVRKLPQEKQRINKLNPHILVSCSEFKQGNTSGRPMLSQIHNPASNNNFKLL